MNEKRRLYDQKNNQKRKDKLTKNAVESVTQKTMLNERLWSRWFKQKPSYRNCKLTAIEAFGLMIHDCYYCGDVALTIDRLDSDKEHTLDNCVGCCDACNRSKGAVDPKTFVLQAVYRTTFEYPEGDAIWYEMKQKPKLLAYKRGAEKRGKQFELTQGQFDELINGMCTYCKRIPTTYFGIDKIVSKDGYTNDNCTTACSSCNWAKWDQPVEEFTTRDKRISDMYFTGCFDDMNYIEKNTSYFRLNTGKPRVSGMDHPMFGKKGALSPNSRKVYQFTMDGTYVISFDSVEEAAESVCGNQSHISACALGKRKSASKFKWSYELQDV